MNAQTAVHGVRRSLTLAIAALVAAALIITGITPAAHAATDDATLTVRVLSSSGAPVTTAGVRAYPLDDDRAAASPIEATGIAGGRYTFASLDSDESYAIKVDTNIGNTNANFTQYYGGGSSLSEARPWRGQPGANTLDFSLFAGSYSGKVLTPKGVGLAGVDVHLFRHDGASWSLIETVTSAAKTGAYAFPALEPGSYTAEFDASQKQKSYISVFAGGAAVYGNETVPHSIGKATVAYVSHGRPAVVNQRMTVGGTLSGTLYASGQPYFDKLRVVPMAIFGTGAARTASTMPTAPLTVSKPNKFSITGLPTGTYAISVDGEDEYLALNEDPYVDPSVLSTNMQTFSVVAGKVRSGITVNFRGDGQPDQQALTTGSLEPAPTAGGGTVTFGDADDFEGTHRNVPIAADGTFEVELRPGRYAYQARARDGADDFKPVYGTFIVSSYTAGATIIVPAEREEDMAFAAVPSVTSNGGTAVGATFSVSAASNHPTTSIVTFQWLRDGIPIFGARTAQYTARGGDVGAAISVRVGIEDLEFVDDVRRTVQAAMITAGDDLEIDTEPTIVAPAVTRPGAVLRATPGVWSESPVMVTYRWLSAGVQVSTAPTYTVRPADATKAITLEVTASKAGHATSDPATSEAVTVTPLAAPVAKVAPKVTSTSKGQPAGSVKYTVSGGTWSPTAKPSYVWTADGAPISTSSTLVWNTATYGTKAIFVTVTAKRDGHADAVRRILVRASTAAYALAPSTTSIVGETDGSRVYSGATITVTPGTWSGPESVTPTFTYTWMRGNAQAKIPGATKASYTVTDADFSLPLYVAVTAIAPGYKSVTSEPLYVGDGWAKSDLTDAQAVVSIGAPVPLAPATAVVSDENGVLAGLEPLTYRYQWFTCRDGGIVCDVVVLNSYTAIPKATGRTYTPPASMAGAYLAVRVTVSKPGYQTIDDLDSWGVRVGPLTESVASVPKITNSGLTSTIAKPTFVPADAADVATYQWIVGDSVVEGADERAFTRTIADAGKPVTVHVSYESGNELYSGGTFERDYLAVRGVIATPAPQPIVGSRLGDTLQAPDYELEYPPTAGSPAVAYQWYLNGIAIKNATLATYRPASATAIGKKISVRVTSTSQRYAPVIVMSPAVKLAAGVNPIGVPTVDVPGGVVKPGVLLSANTSSFTVTGQTFTYQWRLYTGTSWVNIAKATAKTYRVLPTQVGKDLRVVVTGKRAGFASRTAVSASMIVQGSGVVPVVVAPALTGNARAGTTVAVAAGTYGTTAVTASYRWLRNGTVIPGAIASSFALSGSQFGDTIAAEVTLRAVGFTPWTAIVGERVVTAGTAPTATGASVPKITGTAKACSTLTATSGIWSRDGLTFTYRWFTPAGVVEHATGPTLVVPGRGDPVAYRVEVTATSEGFEPGVAVSAYTAKVPVAPECPAP